MELLTIEAFFQLIINIIAFWIMLKIWTKISKKEHEDQLAKERIEWEGERELLEEQIDDFVRNNTYWQDEYTKEKKSNKALKGWNTKYVKTIEGLREEIDKLEYWSDIMESSIENKNKKIDESKILSEKLLTMVKKKDMEEAKAIVKKYYKM